MRRLANSRALLAAIACALAIVGAGAGAGQAAAAPLHRTCGILPGEGFYSYTTTVGIRCKPAEKIAFRAVRKFCALHHDCRYGIHTSPLLVRKGRVAVHGWRCHLRQGYEFSDVRCHRRQMLIHHQSGA